jgi:rfaE bifunctional protein kinase chain/domain
MMRALDVAKRLRSIVKAFSRLKITVLGDMVADEFLFGEITRVSREAPVLILRRRERTVVPGGGANAVSNLADLGVRAIPVGLLGDDEPGRAIRACFRQKRIPVRALVRDGNYATVTKTRILAGLPHAWRQQVVRVDREPERAPSARARRALSVAAARAFATADALIVSDYGYGAASPEILREVCCHNSKRSRPVVLDSRHRMFEFTGITAATPNQPEVEETLGVEIGHDWKRLCSAGKEILERMQLKSLVITRGRDGMVAFSSGRCPVDIPIFGTDQVADVTGAGDTVIATFTAALAAGSTTEEAAHLANYAGGIVVMKRGTATVSQAELLAALAEHPPETRAH